MNRTDRPTSPDSPRRDPVLLAMKAAAAVLALIAVVLIAGLFHRVQAEAALHCPPQDHPVWAASLHQWLRGDSLQAGVKSR